MKKHIFILVLLFLISGCEKKEIECELDEDCIAAGCCHATSCVSKEKTPDCKGIVCTLECRPGTLDCGQGSCKCVEGNCEAIYG